MFDVKERSELAQITQLTHMEEGSEPVNETASTKEEAEGSSSVESECGRFANKMRRK
jgi:hypothetical protein